MVYVCDLMEMNSEINVKTKNPEFLRLEMD